MNTISSLQTTPSPVTPVVRTFAAPSASLNPGSTPERTPLPVNKVNQPMPAQSTDNDLQQAVDQANKVLESKTSKELQFSVDKSTGIPVIKMINQQTGETLLQFPSDAMLQIAKYIDQSTGNLVSKKV
jgi:flagellar protein FlaG